MGINCTNISDLWYFQDTKEGVKIFGSGSHTPIAITLLVKKGKKI